MLHIVIFCISLASASNIITIQNRPIRPENPRTSQYQISRVNGRLTSQTFSLFENLTGLEISWSAIGDLDPTTFQKTRLQILDIHNNIEFPTLTPDTFRYLENLKVLRFNFNPYTVIEEGAFASLRHLTVLSIAHQTIVNLTGEFLKGLYNLQELSLTNNEIKHIDKDAFVHMKQLTAIYLGHNSLRTLELGTFKHQKKLEDIQLQSNRLGNRNNAYFINWDQIDRIVSLRSLNVADNDLRHLNVQKLVTAFPQLQSINFTPNNFTCSNELFIARSLRHYRIDIEYYGDTTSNCRGLDFEVIGATVFADL